MTSVVEESPKGASACRELLVNCRISAMMKFGREPALGVMHYVSSVFGGETCTRWFAFVSHFECRNVGNENPDQCCKLLCL